MLAYDLYLFFDDRAIIIGNIQFSFDDVGRTSVVHEELQSYQNFRVQTLYYDGFVVSQKISDFYFRFNGQLDDWCQETSCYRSLGLSPNSINSDSLL